MKKNVLVTAGIVFFIALFVLIATLSLLLGIKGLNPPAAAAPSTTPTVVASSGPPDTVTVVGLGTSPITPDQAVISLGSSVTASTVRAALAGEAKDEAKVLSALQKQGVATADIQTTSVGVNVVTNCCPSFVTGYSASTNIDVTIHNINNFGSVIASVVDAIGNDATVNGVTLSNSDASLATVQATARATAFANAGTNAQNWATLSHRTLGRLLSLSEVVINPPNTSTCQTGCGGAGGGGGGGGVNLSPGLNHVSLTITATYSLK